MGYVSAVATTQARGRGCGEMLRRRYTDTGRPAPTPTPATARPSRGSTLPPRYLARADIGTPCQRNTPRRGTPCRAPPTIDGVQIATPHNNTTREIDKNACLEVGKPIPIPPKGTPIPTSRAVNILTSKQVNIPTSRAACVYPYPPVLLLCRPSPRPRQAPDGRLVWTNLGQANI